VTQATHVDGADATLVAGDEPILEVPASVGQRALALMQRHRGAAGGLNERLVWRLGGSLDVAALSHAVDELARRHEALRTTFAGRGPRLVQQVRAPRSLELATEPLDTEALDAALAAEGATTITPGERPLRARLWRLAPSDHVLFLSILHLATDQASNAIVARDLARLYEHAARGTPPPAPVGCQYRDWSELQRAALAGPRLAELQTFWRRQLDGARFAALPGRDGADGRLGERAYERRPLDAAVAGGVRALADRCATTPFAVTLAAFFACLHAQSGQRDIALASLFANRDADTADTVGFFVNMLVLRQFVHPDATFARLVGATQATVAASERHGELPFHMLAPGTITTADGAAGRADDVVFQCVEGDPRATAQARVDGLDMEPVEREWRRSRFALELFVACEERAVTPIVVYDTGRFDATWARAFADGYPALLAAATAAPDEPIAVLARRAGVY
jgi:hypothetical protein